MILIVSPMMGSTPFIEISLTVTFTGKAVGTGVSTSSSQAECNLPDVMWKLQEEFRHCTFVVVRVYFVTGR